MDEGKTTVTLVLTVDELNDVMGCLRAVIEPLKAADDKVRGEPLVKTFLSIHAQVENQKVQLVQ